MESKFTQLVRILLGLILIAFGINKIKNFIPLPDMPAAAADFMTSMASSGYILYAVAAFEICIGLMLVFRLWVPFALAALVPLSLNILLFHMFLDVPGIGAAIVVVALNGILVYKQRSKYTPLFTS